MIDKVLGRAIEINSKTETNSLIITPIGEVVGEDKRVFDIDGSKVIENIQKSGLEIPLNINHCFDSAYGSSAGGWFKNFRVENNNIVADLEYTELGQDLVNKKLYKYLSPEFDVIYDGDRRIVKNIYAVGLVNTPNLKTSALNNKEKKVEKTSSDNTNKELKEENERLKEELKQEKINSAIEKNHITPAMGEFAKTLDSGQLDKYLEMNSKEKNHNLAHKTDVGKRKTVELNSTEKQIFTQMGLEV